MPTFLPVPWVRWSRFRVSGVIREKESGEPIPGLVVCAFDKDVVKDDYLGECETDEQGGFEIRFTDADFKDAVESQPDLYLCVLSPGKLGPIHDTSYTIRRNASQDEFYEIEIGRAVLEAARSKQG
jgi:carotenoid cleavage dioxygenase